jgi:hypothetical protein
VFEFKLVYKSDNFLLEKLVSHFKNKFSQVWVGPIEIVGGRWSVRLQDLGRYYSNSGRAVALHGNMPLG